jgi:hypothetical protein
MPHTGSVQTKINSKLTGTSLLGSPADPLDFVFTVDMPNGTGAGQANYRFADLRTLNAAANEDLDLAGGLTGSLGGTLTFTKIKYLGIFAPVTNSGNLVVSRPAANGVAIFAAASDALTVTPGGKFEWSDPTGVTVTPATGDLINVSNPGGAQSKYNVVIIGTV